jgi:hypothetical protein
VTPGRAVAACGAAAAVATLTAGLLLAATAAAESVPSGPLALTMTPALIDAKASSKGPLPTISLINRGRVGFRLKVFPALAAQALEGGLTLRRGSRNDALARRMFRLAAPRFVAAGRTVRVRPFFLSYAGRRSVSVAAVVLAVPLKQPRRDVTYRLNLLGGLFVHRPNATARPAIESVRVSRLGSLRRQLTVRVRNRVDAPAFITSVRFRLRTGQGRVLASVGALPGFVVPRSVRNFRATLFRRLPAGRLRVEAVVRWGENETRRSGFFTAK